MYRNLTYDMELRQKERSKSARGGAGGAGEVNYYTVRTLNIRSKMRLKTPK